MGTLCPQDPQRVVSIGPPFGPVRCVVVCAGGHDDEGAKEECEAERPAKAGFTPGGVSPLGAA